MIHDTTSIQYTSDSLKNISLYSRTGVESRAGRGYEGQLRRDALWKHSVEECHLTQQRVERMGKVKETTPP